MRQQMNALQRGNYIGVIVQVGVVSWILLGHPWARAQQGTPVWQQEVRRYAQAKDWTAAMTIIDRKIDSAPRDLDMRAWRARILTWSGNLAEAEREYLQILAISLLPTRYTGTQSPLVYLFGPLAGGNSRTPIVVISCAELEALDLYNKPALLTILLPRKVNIAHSSCGFERYRPI
jgi:hypothetical protein